MEVAVWDTYVTKQDGTIMNFDIIVLKDEKDEDKIYGYGKVYLESKSLKGSQLTINQCAFCHVEKATEEIVRTIENNGYYVLEIRGCQ
jgi:Domain of unknown function (DUF2024)